MNKRFSTVLLALLLSSLGLNIYLLLGLEFLSAGQPEIAVNDYSRQVQRPSLRGLGSLFDRSSESASQDLKSVDVQLLFDAGDFPASVQAYQLILGSDPSRAGQLKVQWLATAEQWLEEQQLGRVESLIDAFLVIYPYDIAFRSLQVNWLAESGNTLAAIELLYTLISELNPAQQGPYVSQIQRLVAQEIKSLQAQKAWLPLSQFVERLLWHEPQHPPYVLVLAQVQIELKQYTQAKTALYSIQYDAFYAARVKELLDRIALVDLLDAAVPLTVHREHYSVQGNLNGNVSVKLIIDTGASLSVLSRRTFDLLKSSLSPVFVRRASINTAGGKVEAPVYEFLSFQIQDYRIANMQFVVMDLADTSQTSGLLGMNFLKAFNFQIDQGNNVLLLSPR